MVAGEEGRSFVFSLVLKPVVLLGGIAASI
jgi:hypothetical protein